MEPAVVVGFVIACVVLNLVPGPGMLFIAAHGITGGRRAGLAAAGGMASGVVVHTLAAGARAERVASGGTVRAGGHPNHRRALPFVSAVTAWRSAKKTAGAPLTRPRRSLRRTYGAAVLTNLANPKVVLFYLAFVPGSWQNPDGRRVHRSWSLAAP